MRLVRQTTLLNQEWKRKSPDQKEFLEQMRDPKQCPVFEDVLALIENDLEFICSCFSICMETNQVESSNEKEAPNCHLQLAMLLS
jgi:hypothetical protein